MFDQWKVCLCTYKLKASGQETGLESNLGSLTSIFKQVLAGLLNPSFNKSFMRLLTLEHGSKFFSINCVYGSVRPKN